MSPNKETFRERFDSRSQLSSLLCGVRKGSYASVFGFYICWISVRIHILSFSNLIEVPLQFNSSELELSLYYYPGEVCNDIVFQYF